MAEGFAARDWTVAGCGRSEEALERLRQELSGSHFFAAADVSRDAEVGEWCVRAEEMVGAPDLLLNNAAIINRPAPLWEVPAGEFSEVVDINIKGVVNVLRHALPGMMKAGRGVAVNFSSGWGRSGAAEVAPYCATKWAIEGLTQALAAELPPGVAAVALNPGVIDTDMLRRCWGEGAASCSSPREWVRRAVPFLERLGPGDNGKPLTVS